MNNTMVFGIIFAIIVIALLLVFGAGQIINIFCITNNAQVNKAVADLDHEVQSTYNLGTGSSVPFDVRIPQDAMICLVNPDDPSRMNNWNPHPDLYESIQYQMGAKGYNVYIIYGCGNPDPYFRIRHLEVSENFCVNSGTELLLVNMGPYVEIERPSGG